MSRDVAQAFNRYYNQEFFPIPEPIITGTATRVMSLKNGLNKMSKSDPSDQSRINLMDDSISIIKKIQKARTDSEPFPKSLEEMDNRPEINNLINIFSALSEDLPQNIIAQYVGKILNF